MNQHSRLQLFSLAKPLRITTTRIAETTTMTRKRATRISWGGCHHSLHRSVYVLRSYTRCVCARVCVGRVSTLSTNWGVTEKHVVLGRTATVDLREQQRQNTWRRTSARTNRALRFYGLAFCNVYAMCPGGSSRRHREGGVVASEEKNTL